MTDETCPLCGYRTIGDEFDICDICGWEHDLVQESNPDSPTGANRSSFRRAQGLFAEQGLWKDSPDLRRPAEKDTRDPEWRPLLQPDQFNIVGLRNLVSDSDADYRDRIDAVRLIGALRDQEATELVLGHLDDSDEVMRKAVVEALGCIPDQRARMALRSLLVRTDVPDEVFLCAIEAVGQQVDGDAVPLLVDVAARSDAIQMTQIACVLCKIGGRTGYAGAKQVFDRVPAEWRKDAANIMKSILEDARVNADAVQRGLIDDLLAHITNHSPSL